MASIIRLVVLYVMRRPILVVFLLLVSISGTIMLLANTQKKTDGLVEGNEQQDLSSFDGMEEIKTKETGTENQSQDGGSRVCNVLILDPFNKNILDYMKDFGEHVCTTSNELNVEVTSSHDDVSGYNAKFLLTGYNINYIKSTEIAHDAELGFKLLDSEYLVKARISQPTLTKGQSGAIQNQASERCIVPEKYDFLHPPDQINLIYSSSCLTNEAQFFFTNDGHLVHNVTGKCIGPSDGSKTPEKNVQLALTYHCDSVFDSIQGLLQHSGGMCVHPLWGGEKPEEGQKICLYPECESNKRLLYRWYIVSKAATEKSSISVSLKKELSYAEVEFTDKNSVNTFLLAVQPKAFHINENNILPNVFVLIMDEVSSPHFKRKLPKSYKYMMEEMEFLEYYVHSAVTESVKANIDAVLTGDDVSKSLYDIAHRTNYVTLYSGDRPVVMPYVTAVNHTSVPLFASMKKYYDLAAHSHCVLSQPIYELTFTYLQTFIKAYLNAPKFVLAVLSEINHGNFNVLGYMDNGFTKFLTELKQLKNTIVIVKTIKGSSLGKLSQVQEGKNEYKRPFLGTYISEDLRTKLKFEAERRHAITTPHDVYVTVAEIMSSEEQQHAYGESLFKKTQPRTCKQAGVQQSMCPCI